MKTEAQKRGKNNKNKGALYERISADFWSEELETDIRRTPRSGGFVGLKTDLMDMGVSIMRQRNLHIEVKGGNYAKVSAKFQDMIDKSEDDSEGNPNWLELHQKYGEPLIFMKRKHFATLLRELNGFIKYE